MDRRQQRTRAAIYEAVTELLRHKSFDDLTVQDIIDEANIGRSTFYSHFETKESLLDQMCREMFVHVFESGQAPEQCHDLSNGVTDVKERLTHVLWHIKDHGDNVRSIIGGESEKVFTGYFREYLKDAFSCNISHIRSGVPDDFKEQFLIGSFIETVKWWIRTGMKMSPEETVDNYLRMIK